ncbi:hypothetical protein BGZ63DRAFT_429535 [Mariannaea sp. PMI_226]|nr:hypothetical protein BGZ63DRAFT_429535 [Mariannaea sp. PMI_226]
MEKTISDNLPTVNKASSPGYTTKADAIALSGALTLSQGNPDPAFLANAHPTAEPTNGSQYSKRRCGRGPGLITRFACNECRKKRAKVVLHYSLAVPVKRNSLYGRSSQDCASVNTQVNKYSPR